MSKEENLRREIEQREKLLGNMTIGELIQDMAMEFINIIHELIVLPANLSLNFPLDIISVFTKKNRLVYIGILFVFAGMFSMFANR